MIFQWTRKFPLLLTRTGVALLLMLGVTVTVSVLSMTDVFVYTPDSARYLIWGQSLARFEGYVDKSGPETARYVVHAPLFSLFLVPALWVSSPIIAAKAVNIVFVILVLVLMFLFVRAEHGDASALAAIGFLFLNPLLILFSTQILSDLAFVAAILLIFILAGRMMNLPHHHSLPRILSYAVLLSCAVLLRELGIAILVAVGAAMALRKDYRPALLFFLTTMTVYLLWIVRNELLVGNVEHPPIRNMALLTSHLFTTDDATLLQEWWERLKANASVYRNLLGRLMFLTQHHPRHYGVFFVAGEPYFSLTNVLAAAEWLWILVPTAGSAYGLMITRRSDTTRLFLLFMLPYLSLVLIYPFNDQRFLLPLLPFQALLLVAAFKDLRERLGRRFPGSILKWTAVAGGIVMVVPNIVWTYSYLQTSAQYRESPIRFYEKTVGRADFPDLFTKPVRFVGEWLNKTTDGPVVVGSFWKELAFRLENHKLMDLNQLLPVDQFENTLRDYEIRYLVVAVGRHGIREFESQMALTRKFSFQTTYRVGNLEVVRVTSREAGRVLRDTLTIDTEPRTERVISLWKEQKTFRDQFQTAVTMLADGNVGRARPIIDTLTTQTGGFIPVLFFSAVAREFSNELKEAGELFGRMRFLSQSGPYLVHAYYHLQLMRLTETAMADTNRRLRAQRFHSASLNYWNLGFRHQAWELLDRSLQSDSAFAPGLIFGVFYKIQDGDTSGAEKYYQRLLRFDPTHSLVRPLGRVLAIYDLLKSESSRETRLALALELASLYEQIGIRENAIDELLHLLKVQPENRPALQHLAALYIAKERYQPAKRALTRALELDPSDETVRKNLTKLIEERY